MSAEWAQLILSAFLGLGGALVGVFTASWGLRGALSYMENSSIERDHQMRLYIDAQLSETRKVIYRRSDEISNVLMSKMEKIDGELENRIRALEIDLAVSNGRKKR